MSAWQQGQQSQHARDAAARIMARSGNRPVVAQSDKSLTDRERDEQRAMLRRHQEQRAREDEDALLEDKFYQITAERHSQATQDSSRELHSRIDKLQKDLEWAMDQIGVMRAEETTYVCGAVPRRATTGAAGYDLVCAQDTVLNPAEPTLVPTGTKIALPSRKCALLMARSSFFKKGLSAHVGLIDSDYRGDIMVGMTNLTTQPITLAAGDRVGQLLIVDHAASELKEVSEKKFATFATARGAGGFGSTGK